MSPAIMYPREMNGCFPNCSRSCKPSSPAMYALKSAILSETWIESIRAAIESTMFTKRHIGMLGEKDPVTLDCSHANMHCPDTAAIVIVYTHRSDYSPHIHHESTVRSPARQHEH